MEPIDGFTYSMSQLMLPISYRAEAQAQMEILRLAKGVQWSCYVSPPNGPIPAFGQIEYQVSMPAGSYIWGWSFAALTSSSNNFHILVTDSCTETALSSDYILASLINSASSVRRPCILPQPRLISDPGLVNVEIYNNGSSAVLAQLALFCASPFQIPPADSLLTSNPGFHRG